MLYYGLIGYEKMEHGHWIPISKGFLKALPHDREYTELEAAYSLQIDYDCKNKVTVTGYSNLWRWSKGKVYRFLDRMNIKILYPESTSKKRNQNGLITIHNPDLKRTNNGLITDLKQTNNRLIRLIDNNNLQAIKDLKQTKNGLKTDLKQVTTIDTIIHNTNPKEKKDSPELKNSSKPIILIPLANKTNYPIYHKDITAWQKSYPAVDILQALRSIREWNLSNPKKQKTPTGIRRHITTWLGKEQNKGGNQLNPKTGSQQIDTTIFDKV